MPAARADDPGRKPRGNCHHTKRRTLLTGVHPQPGAEPRPPARQRLPLPQRLDRGTGLIDLHRPAPPALLDQPRPDGLVQAHPGALHLHPPRTRPLQQLAQLNLRAVELAPGYALALTQIIEIMKRHKTSPF